MTRYIPKATLSGCVTAPPSKSMAHRRLIAAALTPGETKVSHLEPSQDVLATVGCLETLGASIRWEGDAVYVGYIDPHCPKDIRGLLDCKECGTTIRLLIPLVWVMGVGATFGGTKTLISRPMGVYEAISQDHRFVWKQEETTIYTKGCLLPGNYTLPGDVSSQFVSGMLYALALLEGESTLTLTGHVESRSYIDLTLKVLKESGITAGWKDGATLYVFGGAFGLKDTVVEGDWSNAAPWYGLSAMGHDLEILGLDPHDLQGDRISVEYFQRLREGMPTLSVEDCPDIAPYLMAVGAVLGGCILTHTKRLQYKESDRGRVMAEELAKCGIQTEIEENRIVVHPGGLVAPKEPLKSHNDHRIAMALAMVLTEVGGEIEGIESVNKSYPSFFDTLNTLIPNNDQPKARTHQ